MAVVNESSTFLENLVAQPHVLGDPGLFGGIVKCYTIKHEVTAGDSATSTYRMCRLPSNARILGASSVSWDDLASSGSPTIDIGVANVADKKAVITNDPDAINDGLSAAAAASRASVIKSIDDYGKMVWEFVNGQTTDPKGDLDIMLTLADAAANDGGTIVLELYIAFA